MSNVTIQKRGKYYQYKFEIARVDGKRKFANKSGFKTKAEAEREGIIAYNNYINTGHDFEPSDMSYSDLLDSWIQNYCYINLKYHTIEAYSSIVKNHIKPNIGFYKVSQITRSTLQEFINSIYIKKSFSKNFLNNIKKVIKSSFTYAYENDLLKINPSIGLKLPKYDVPPKDPAYIFTNEEMNLILDRFQNNHCVYYAFLTAYCTGLRVAEVFALTWEDIDFRNKTETKIVNAYSEIDVLLPEVNFVFVKKNGVYEGTDSCKYPFKVIHYELGISCRFHDFRDTHATKLIESGADIKSVSRRLGHRSIDFTYNIYVRVTEKMEQETADKFEEVCGNLCENKKFRKDYIEE